MTSKKDKANNLQFESSPYLLQHANNPVDWNIYNSKIIEQAKQENKLIIVSIGYSACHWCHVMEKETFEDEQAAEVMNKNYISIKIDREERPDLDHYYMAAAHLMNGNGGWPLNCICLPNGKPFFAGTYFRKKQWMNLLNQISDLWKTDELKVKNYANEIEAGIKSNEIINAASSSDFNLSTLHQMVENWSKNFDSKNGGNNRAPKFPMPNNLDFLMHYGTAFNNLDVLKHCHNTLTNMALGGIYDQIGGGFARYSVDEYWKVPHFEKMLYDNAQLIKTYSNAYKLSKNPLYARIVDESIGFLNRELQGDNNAYFSALDADSEGIEGKFYVWNQHEIEDCLKEDASFARIFFKMNEQGLWEHDNYILLSVENEDSFAASLGLSLIEFEAKRVLIKSKLLNYREKRIRPSLDDKILCSWNAMTTTALFIAYQSFNNSTYLSLGLKNLDFISKNLMNEQGDLFHSYKNGTSKINGFLEDYAFTIEAFIEAFICTSNIEFLIKAEFLTKQVFERFEAENKQSFYFSQRDKNEVSVPKIEIYDNVIPSSNSVMANNLIKLGSIFANSEYLDYAKTMLNSVQNQMPSYGSGFSNWGISAIKQYKPHSEIVVSGNNSDEDIKTLWNAYHPNSIITFYKGNKSTLHLFTGKENNSKISKYYRCNLGSCDSPTSSAEFLFED